MGLFKKKLPVSDTIAVSAARRREHPPTAIQTEYRLYEHLRDAVPIIDAAICKIIRLAGCYKLVCSDENLQDELDDFVMNVNVGMSGKSLYAFTDVFLDSLLMYGNAVGEIMTDPDTLKIAGLGNGKIGEFEIHPNSTPSKKVYCVVAPDGQRHKILHPELILFSAINTRSGDIYGNSVLKGLPAVSRTLLKIFECIENNFERAGNIRYAVTYNPGNDPGEKALAKDRAQQIAQEWSSGMNAARSGEIRDFIAVGDVGIKVIGSENQLFDTNIPVRQLLEQIVSKLAIPPFLLGLSWSSTERMSAQQADILTSELEYYRRRLTPVIVKIATAFLRSIGSESTAAVEWENINLQDERSLAEARLKNAQAEKLERETSAES
ncbi:MAG: phage portal protein [Oscillospiraceae bacterium]|jgi:hypothetical protein|nr:phage portal protein [Oscillospiraceae bacterium]